MENVSVEQFKELVAIVYKIADNMDVRATEGSRFVAVKDVQQRLKDLYEKVEKP